MIKAELKGVEAFNKKMRERAITLDSNLKREMGRLTAEMHTDLISTIQTGGRSGKIYGKRRHQASAPGEPPKTDSGELVSSITFGVNNSGKAIVGFIKAASKHAAILEFKPSSKGGRPFMRPLYKKWRKDIKNRLNIAVKSAIKKG